MQDSSVIAAYAELLERKLVFSPTLARRVRQEVEDHLWEAVAAGPAGKGCDAAQRAIADFGDPHVIATQFATAWLVNQTRKVGATVILVIACVFAAMKGRVAWYAATQWELSDDVRAVGKLVGAIDAYAFLLSVIVGVAGWAYLVSRRGPPAALYAAHCRHLRRVLYLSIVSAAALAVSVISDGVLTALRLLGRESSAEFLVPISSMAIELVCAAILIFSVRGFAVRMAQATALLKT